MRNPAVVRKLLIEGLAQAEVDCTLPEVFIRRNLTNFITEELSTLLPSESIRVIAHPPLQVRNGGYNAVVENMKEESAMAVEGNGKEHTVEADSIRFSQLTAKLDLQRKNKLDLNCANLKENGCTGGNICSVHISCTWFNVRYFEKQ